MSKCPSGYLLLFFLDVFPDFLVLETGELGLLLPLVFLPDFRFILEISEIFIGSDCMYEFEMLAG
jgi:hypothetical protein